MNAASKPVAFPVRLLATSNLLAALGGGTLLGEARKVAKVEGLSGDTTIALFCGISLGLVVVIALPTRVKDRAPPLFSLAAVLASCALAAVLWTGGSKDDNVWTIEGTLAWFFWLLLVARFAVWFVARIFRTDYSAGQGGGIAWVELSYFVGTVLGLIAWKFIRLPISVLQLLVLDAFFQSVATVIDLRAVRAIAALRSTTQRPVMVPTNEKSSASRTATVATVFDWSGYGALLFAFSSLTLAVQIVTFAFSGLALAAREFAREDLFGSSVLASSYLGAAMAAYLYNFASLRLVWPIPDTAKAGMLSAAHGRWTQNVSIVWLITLIALLETAYIVCYFNGAWPWAVLLPIVAATIAYEVIALAVADRIGDLAKAARRPGMTAMAYAVSALLGTIALVILSTRPVTQPTRLLVAFAIISLLVAWGTLAWPRSWTRGILIIADQIGGSAYSPPTVARALLQNRLLPDVAAYLSPSSACYWLGYSGTEARQRSNFEAEAWEVFHVSERLAVQSDRTVRLIGLAVGEGRGEIALIQRMLRDPNSPRRIDYLAVDLAPVLLVHHVQTVREVFALEIDSGRLVVAGLVADIYDLPAILTRARSLCLSPQSTTRRDSKERFFSDDRSPLLLTYLGNCLGNAEFGQENSFLDTLKAAFPNHTPYTLILGVSVAQTPPETYDPMTWRFFLADLRRLSEGCGPLISQHSNGVPAEFTLPTDDPHDPLFLRRCVADFPEDDQPLNYHAGGIVGQLYRFHYRLDYSLHLRGDRAEVLHEGETVQVYSIIKYDLESLKRFFEINGYEVQATGAKTVSAFQGTRRYQVLAITPRDSIRR